MKTPPSVRVHPASLLAMAMLVALPGITRAQVTNWAAYNDHMRPDFPSPTPPPAGQWGNALRTTTYNMGYAASSGNLTNFLNGAQLPVTMTVTPTGAPDNFGGIGKPMPTNTPMAALFFGVCDLSTDGLVGVRAVPPNASESFVTISFGGLDAAKRYVFRGTVARNGSYADRWSVAAIQAAGSVDAHIPGLGGPGVLTGANFPASGLAPEQAAFHSGHNREGAVVGWDFITPFPDGTFSVTVKQYTGAIPTPPGTASGPYGYGFGALLLAEVEAVPPTITVHPVANTTVEENRPFSLSVVATGTPLQYQWYKEGEGGGAISGAIFPTYTVPQAALSDSGNYYAVAFNPLRRATSSVAQVNVFADTTAPAVGTIFSFPTVDGAGIATLDQIVIEFNEPITAASVSSPASYTVPGGGNPVEVIVTNNQSVILKLATPLAVDTDYSVTVSAGTTDMEGNVAGSLSAPFHSWVPGIGNGLLFEAYNAGPGVEVVTLENSPDFPDNPFARATLGVFDSRQAFSAATDADRSNYGVRISGVFIPPVSGNWLFYFRTRNRGVVYLNPNGTDPAGKMEILRESTGNTPLNWNRFTSPPQALRAGQAYYIETLHKTESGEGFTKVAARLQGTGFPEPVDFPTTEVDPNAIPGALIGFPLAPKDLGGTLAIVQDLANVTAEENNLTTFSIQLNNPSKLPLQYQWFRDGVAITAGGNGPTYTIQPTIAADNNATFSVRVAKVGSVVTSRTATLTVVPDVTRPVVLEASNSYLTPNFITVRFNELLFIDDAQNTFGYEIADNSTIGAVLQPDGKTVILEMFAPLTAGVAYQLKVTDVTDLAGLFVNPNPTNVTLTGSSDLPRLTLVRNDIYVDISWAVTSSTFTLEQTDAFLDPVSSTVWTPVGSAPVIVNGRNLVSLTINPSKSFFFRLRQ